MNSTKITKKPNLNLNQKPLNNNVRHHHIKSSIPFPEPTNRESQAWENLQTLYANAGKDKKKAIEEYASLVAEKKGFISMGELKTLAPKLADSLIRKAAPWFAGVSKTETLFINEINQIVKEKQ